MKKAVFALVAFVLSAAVFSICVFSSEIGTSTKLFSQSTEKNDVLTLADKDNDQPDASKVLETRFLNMLNHNFVYNESFHSVETIVNDSMPALLSFKESEDSEYIKECYVADYIYNMYGIEISDFSEINTEFEQKEGYVFILPKGYEVLTHRILGITENEDGTFKVKTEATINTHDGVELVEICESLLVRNPQSQFGFNIVYSDILSTSKTI